MFHVKYICTMRRRAAIARWAHNPQVAGLNPAVATILNKGSIRCPEFASYSRDKLAVQEKHIKKRE